MGPPKVGSLFKANEVPDVLKPRASTTEHGSSGACAQASLSAGVFVRFPLRRPHFGN